MASGTSPVRIGLIGCGHIGRFHSRNLRNLVRSNASAVRMTAVCDHSEERAAEFARLLNAPLSTVSATELIHSREVDAVYICTETHEHLHLVAAAAAAGKAVFCEKPLAKNLADAETLLRAVTVAGVTHQVGLVLRFSPIFRVLEDLIERLDVGDLMTAHMRDDQFLPVRGHYNSSWRGDVNRAGGGTLIEHSIHDVDLFRRLFGEIDRVHCDLRFAANHPGIDDLALVRFQHASGAQTTLTSIWHDIDSRGSTRQIELFYRRGYFATNDDYFGTIRYQLQHGDMVELSEAEVRTRFCMLEGLDPEEFDQRRLGGLGDFRFAEAVRTGTSAYPDFSVAVAAHRVVDACYRSASEHADISLG